MNQTDKKKRLVLKSLGELNGIVWVDRCMSSNMADKATHQRETENCNVSWYF